MLTLDSHLSNRFERSPDVLIQNRMQQCTLTSAIRSDIKKTALSGLFLLSYLLFMVSSPL